MGINLTKGGSVSLTKQAGGQLNKVCFGLAWDPSDIPGVKFDLDASIFGLGANGLVVAPEWFVFFNNLSSPGASIVHQGDELTGDTEGDDEQIVVDLTALPGSVVSLPVYVCIFEAKKRAYADPTDATKTVPLTFAKVPSASVRIINEETGTELAKYDLTHDAASNANALHFGTLTRDAEGWSFTAVGEGTDGEIDGVVAKYGV